MYPTNLQVHNAIGNITATLRYLKGEFERADHLDADERSWRVAAAERALDDLATLKAALNRDPAPEAADWTPTPLDVLAASLPALSGGGTTIPDDAEYEAWLDTLDVDRRDFHQRVAEVNR